MAVFFVNVCKFNSCGLKFSSLQELIRHIEESHLDLEQKSLDTVGNAVCLPVSCVLRIYSDDVNPLSSSIDLNSNTLNESHVRKHINSPAVSLSTTPTDGSELDGEDADSDSGQSSIDSWATANADSTTNPLTKFHQIMGSTASAAPLDENNNSTKLSNGTNNNKEQREYICGFSGCTKRYRSSNSLSHHRRSAHKLGNIVVAKPAAVDDSNKKTFNCFCGKTYKTSHGLKNHCNIHHSQVNSTQVVNGNSCNANMVIASNALEIKQEMPAQVSSFVQISSTTKPEISPSVKETLLNSISKAKPSNGSNMNGDFMKLKNGTFMCSEIISDNNCPPVCSNVEVVSEPKAVSKYPPIISAPTLQQHLLSPIIPKVASN